jgi:hypothetical protein
MDVLGRSVRSRIANEDGRDTHTQQGVLYTYLKSLSSLSLRSKHKYVALPDYGKLQTCFVFIFAAG